MTRSIRPSTPLFRAEGLGQDDLLPLIEGMPATRIAFILDTCYSATVADAGAVLRRDVNTSVTNRIGHASGRFVLSGSLTEAFDSAAGSDARIGEEGHGLFTSYLLRALRGDAGTDEDGRIDIYKLAEFTQAHVASASRRNSGTKHRATGREGAGCAKAGILFRGQRFLRGPQAGGTHRRPLIAARFTRPG